MSRICLLILNGTGTADRLCTSANSGVRPPWGYEPARLSSRRPATARATRAEAGENTGTSSLRDAMAPVHVQKGLSFKKPMKTVFSFRIVVNANLDTNN